MNGKSTRWTKQLKVIVDIIYNSEGPMTADDVYMKARKRLPAISLGTVYRNLNKLVAEGLVSETMSNGISTFSRHPFPSAHFECTVCHRLINVPIELNVLDLSKKAGNRVERWSLHLTGVCKDCDSRCT